MINLKVFKNNVTNEGDVESDLFPSVNSCLLYLYYIAQFWESFPMKHLRDKNLTLYLTILTFNDLEKEAYWKHCGKTRKCCLPVFYPFPTLFSIISKTNLIFSVSFILSSSIASNLDLSKNLLCEVSLFQIILFLPARTGHVVVLRLYGV